MTMTAETFDARTAAKKLGFTYDHTLDLIYAGKLKAINIALTSGKARWVITQKFIDEFLSTPTNVVPQEVKPATRRRKAKLEPVTEYF